MNIGNSITRHVVFKATAGDGNRWQFQKGAVASWDAESANTLTDWEVEGKLELFEKRFVFSSYKFIGFFLMLSSSQSRIDMIGAACESAEKVLADTRKAYCFGTRQGPQILPTLDKGQALKIQEQENLLRAAVNSGEGDTLYCPVSLELLREPAYISFAS